MPDIDRRHAAEKKEPFGSLRGNYSVLIQFLIVVKTNLNLFQCQILILISFIELKKQLFICN